MNRSPKLTRHRCGANVLVGLDGDRCALVATVDPYPLNLAGEVAALRDHRRTYWLNRGALDPRDQWTIPAHPADQVTVLADHRCGSYPQAEHLMPAARPTATPTPASTEEIPW